jgi:hypothetical protein
MGLFDAIASTVGNLTDNVVGMVNQNHQNKVNLRMMREQNAFNADQAQMQRDWQQQMWGMNNAYNSPSAMISRGMNPFVQGSAAMAGSRSPASGGSAATAAPVPSMQAYKPNFSDIGSALASMAQARASMINAEQNASLTPYQIDKLRGDTDYRNIGVGESGYWNKSTGRESALLDQSKEYQELKNMEFAGRLTSAQESQILLDSEAQQVLNKYLDQNQQADLFIKGQTLANLFAQGALTEAQYKSEMAKAVKLSVETNGLRIQNRIASETADSLIYANIHANRALGLSSLWDSKNVNTVKNMDYSKDKAIRDYYKWSAKEKQKDVNSYNFRKSIEYGSGLLRGAGSIIGAIRPSE